MLPALEALGLPPGSASALSERQLTTIAMQFGSLGSGNHFVEVCLDERDRVWIVLHSGSRGIGNQLATAHIKTARLIAQEEGQVLEDRDLAWLAEGRPEFDAYVADMLWAQRYAWGNREQMMDAALAALRAWRCRTRSRPSGSTATTTTRSRRPTGGEEVWITRKGAIRAGRSDMGVIPGSMGASSFIVRGKGNEESYQSSSHGAGRRLGRKAAFRQLTHRVVAQRHGGPGVGRHHGRAVGRRAPRCLQADRPGDGRPGRPGRGRPRAAPGREPQGDVTAP